MVTEQSFCSRFKIYDLLISILAFVFKLFHTPVEIFHSQGIFPKSNNYLAIKEIFYKKCFTLSRKCYINNEILHSQGNLPRQVFT